MRLEVCSVDRILRGIHVAELVMRASEVFHDLERLATVLAVWLGLVLAGVCRIVRSRVDSKVDLTSQQLLLEILLLLIIALCDLLRHESS